MKRVDLLRKTKVWPKVIQVNHFKSGRMLCRWDHENRVGKRFKSWRGKHENTCPNKNTVSVSRDEDALRHVFLAFFMYRFVTHCAVQCALQLLQYCYSEIVAAKCAAHILQMCLFKRDILFPTLKRPCFEGSANCPSLWLCCDCRPAVAMTHNCLRATALLNKSTRYCHDFAIFAQSAN